MVSALCGAGAYAWSRPRQNDEIRSPELAAAPRGDRLRDFVAWSALLLLWAGYAAFFSYLSITNHHGIRTQIFDLGVYDNIFYNSSHGRPLVCSFVKGNTHASAHFDPILVLLSPIYFLYPRAELLLVLQSIWLGSGVIPIYLLARRKLGARAPAVAFAAMYTLYPALHGANMYDFHSLTLIVPIVLFMLFFLEVGAHRLYFATLLLALLCREDVSLLMCFVGLYALLIRRHGSLWQGLITIAASIAYFIVAKRFFMPSSEFLNSWNEAYSYSYYYESLIPNDDGISGLLLSMLTNPAFVLRTLVLEAKVLHLFKLFLPLVFLPFFIPKARVMLVYGLLFCLLASKQAVYSTHFQYSSLIAPIAFAIAPMALLQIERASLVAALGLNGRRLRRAALGAALAASLLCSWKFGAFAPNKSFKMGFHPPIRALERASPRRTSSAHTSRTESASTITLGRRTTNSSLSWRTMSSSMKACLKNRSRPSTSSTSARGAQGADRAVPIRELRASKAGARPVRARPNAAREHRTPARSWVVRRRIP